MFKTSDYVWNVCSGRYAEFAIHLNSQGYGVFGMDWIGILDIQPFTLLNSCFDVSYCLVYTLNHEFWSSICLKIGVFILGRFRVTFLVLMFGMLKMWSLFMTG